MRWLKKKIQRCVDRAVANALAEQGPDTVVSAVAEVPPLAPPLPIFDILVERQGYGKTRQSKTPVSADGAPIPWYTYPAIEYFDQLDARGLRIFEYGSGNSSLFWARKGANVWSVEHDSAWFEKMVLKSACLRQIVLRGSPEDYANAIAAVGGEFDLIIIDGVWRNECAAAALPYLRKGGCIILDNSDWYSDVAAYLRGRGLFQVDFNGFGPINEYCWTTSLFLPAETTLTSRLNDARPIGGIDVCKSATW